MATAVQSSLDWTGSLAWLRDFLREELAPYPGRAALVARMVLTVTIVMLINNIFRLPFAAFGAVFALTISRENPEATINAVRVILVSFAVAVVDVLVGAFLFSGDPLLRLIWVIATLFIVFFLLSAMANYGAAFRFGFLVAITIPLWDLEVPAEEKVESTLWAIGALSLASVITAVVEIVFAQAKPWDDLSVSLAERLSSVERLLRSRIEGVPDTASEQQVVRLATLGTSRMRRDLQRSDYTTEYTEKMGAVVAFTGRMVDIGANMAQFSDGISLEDKGRFLSLCDNIAGVRDDFLNRRVPHLVKPYADESSRATIPLLSEMERSVSLIAAVFAGLPGLGPFAPSTLPAEPRRFRLFAPDAFTNVDHIHFGIRGGLAASLCYIIYNLLAWPGLFTAVLTCLLTALTTIGASRQKQVLRFGGAFLGAAIGMGGQIFILPGIDSITGFLLFFVTVSIFAAWVAASGPRLSYFGVQITFVFYLINLGDFKFQTSLTIARDRIVGILLGLFVMWLVFDQLWSTPAVVAMKRAFIATLRLLAQLAREPVSSDLKVAIEKSYSLRETINNSLESLRLHGDGVLLEFGASRQRDLALRSQLIEWQLRLRMIFVARIALLKYRLDLPGFQLPPPLQDAQQKFDGLFAARLDAVANRLEGKPPAPRQDSDLSIGQLEQIALACCAIDTPEQPAAPLQTFLPLSRRIDGLLHSVEEQVG